MAGNVLEWVADWSGLYSSGPQMNPKGPVDGEHRVLRGGSWYFDMNLLRSTYRFWSLPTLTSHDIGFRCVIVRQAP